MKKIAAVLITLACTLPGFARADGPEPETPTDGRMKVLMYDDTDVYTIMTKYGYQTNIVFDKTEDIQTISVGDRTLWQIVPAANRLFIRPMEENAATNMTVLTNKRSYQFDLKSGDADTDPNSIIYVAKFIYPAPHKEAPPAMAAVTPPPPAMPAMPETAPKPVVLSSAAPVPAPEAEPAPAAEPAAAPEPSPEPHLPVIISHKNDRYSFSGPDNLAPLEAFDNGTSTFIKFRDMNNLPDPYVVDAHGLEKPVAYYTQDGYMVIDRVVGEIEFKNPAGNISVYNELLDPR